MLLLRFQSLILSRPIILNEGYCSVPLPEANLEYDSAYPSKPSPITPMVLQSKLIRSIENIWTARFLDSKEATSTTEKVENWFADLPPVFRTNPNTMMDAKFPYLKFQRLQLHCIGYSAILGILKPYLTRSSDAKDLTNVGLDYALLATAVDYALLQMGISQQLYDLYAPFYTKNFIIAFTPFDTAALLCSAILRDPQRDLPRRHDVIAAIGKGLSLIKQLKPHTRVGSISYNVLTSLIATLTLTHEEKILIDSDHDVFPSVIERPAKRVATCDLSSTRSGNTNSSKEPSPEDEFPTPGALMPLVVGGQLQEYDWQFDPNLLLGTQPLCELDLGVLEPVWDWENINFPDTHDSKGLNGQVKGPGLL